MFPVFATRTDDVICNVFTSAFTPFSLPVK